LNELVGRRLARTRSRISTNGWSLYRRNCLESPKTHLPLLSGTKVLHVKKTHPPPPPTGRVGNFRQKNYSAEDGIDGTNGYFRRNSGCSAEQELSEFRSEPFPGRESNSEFRSVDKKNRSNLSEFRSEPFRRRENNSEFRPVD
jgi:hypothetical protein